MPRVSIKKTPWTTTKKVLFTSGIGVTSIISCLVWAGKAGETQIVRPYMRDVIRFECNNLHRPIEEKLSNLESDMRVVRCILEVTVSREKLEEAKKNAQNPIFKVQ